METLGLLLLAVAALLAAKTVLFYGVMVVTRPLETVHGIGFAAGVVAARAKRLLTG